MSLTPTLVYLYGPPASGKLTIAEPLAEITGFTLFHNHLTVNAVRAVFEFGSPAFVGVLHRVRLDVFATAMRSGISLVFTNNSAWGGPDGRARFAAFADAAAQVVDEAGGQTVFVQITAPAEVLESRVANESRHHHAKLVNSVRLREMLAELDASPLHADDLTIDSSTLSPADAASHIAATLTS